MDKVVHFHIPVDDMTRAKKFYAKIFGWEIKDTGMGRDYQLATTTPVDEKMMPTEPGAINGALYLREDPKEAVSIVINVPSIDEYLKRIEKREEKSSGLNHLWETLGFMRCFQIRKAMKSGCGRM